MARIAVGGLHHETNSFAPIPADWDAFEFGDGWPRRQRGESLFAGVAGINLAITGFVDAARAAGHDLVPLVWANACPSGPVTTDAYERLVGSMLEDLAAAGPVDGVFLDLHGAMVTEALDDGEGELLRRLRLIAPAVPVVAALDLHANVSPAMVAHSDALIAYRTYPHVDIAETGARCLPLLERLMRGETIARAHRKLDFMIPLPWTCTTLEPSLSLYALADALAAEIGGAVSIAMGFPPADTSVGGPSMLAYGGDAAATDHAAARMAEAFRAAEPRFAGRIWSPEDAVAEAMRMAPGRPVVLADTQDNAGGGGTSDTTRLLRTLIAADARDAVLGLMVDGETALAAHAAGAGGWLRGYGVGGRHGPEGETPMVADWYVERLGDGRFTATGPVYLGSRMALGPMALLRAGSPDGVGVVVSTTRVQAADQAMFRHLGVEPAACRILALKSSVHFRADFEPIAAAVLVVEAPGANIFDPSLLPFTRLPETIRRRPAQPARA